MYNELCEVLANRSVAPRHFVLQLRSKKISHAAKPGQFVQVLAPGESYDPLLARPFSFLDADGSEFSILYQVVGRGTSILSKLVAGESARVLGPLGNGFTLEADRKRKENSLKALVGGGVGIPPLYHLAKYWADKSFKKDSVHVFLGARNKSLLLCEKEFKKLGVVLHLSTDDGSRGEKGFVTTSLHEFLKKPEHKGRVSIHACGPTPMLEAVSAIAIQETVPCEVSVEVPMACGFGACLGCAIKVRTVNSASLAGSQTDFRYAIACTEGPVFKGSEILWQ